MSILRRQCHQLRPFWRYRSILRQQVSYLHNPAIVHVNRKGYWHGPIEYVDATETEEMEIIGKWREFPVTLFRLQQGKTVNLRDYSLQKGIDLTGFDVCTEDEIAFPLKGKIWKGPNGASMYPNTFTFNELVRNYRGRNVTIYKIPQGTKVPEDMALIHEYGEKFSLQCAEPMMLRILNNKMSMFLSREGEELPVDKFLKSYPIYWEKDFDAQFENRSIDMEEKIQFIANQRAKAPIYRKSPAGRKKVSYPIPVGLAFEDSEQQGGAENAGNAGNAKGAEGAESVESTGSTEPAEGTNAESSKAPTTEKRKRGRPKKPTGK